MKAMLLAAGLGTRLKPFTDKHPKALAVVNGKTILQRNIEYLQTFGVTDFIINVHHFANQIKDYLKQHNYFNINIIISDESDAVLETGGGLKKASWFLQGDDSFFLMNVDILTTADLLKMILQHAEQKPLATLAVSDRLSSRCFLFNEANELCGWRNTQSGEEKISKTAEVYYPFSFSGIHLIHPSLLTMIRQEGKFSMVDVYLDLAKREQIVAFDHSGSLLMDVGKPERIVEAEKYFR